MARSTRSGSRPPGADDGPASDVADTGAVSPAPEPSAPSTEAPPPAPDDATVAGTAATDSTPPRRDPADVDDAVLADVDPLPTERAPDDLRDTGSDSTSPADPEPSPAEPEVRPTAPGVTPPVPVPAPRRASVLPLVLGGAVAAALGYAAAWTDILPRPPDPAMTARIDDLAAAQDALQGSLDALAGRPDTDDTARARLDTVEASATDQSARLDDLLARTQALSDEAAALAQRLQVLEDRPQVTVALSEQAQAAVEAQIAALRQEAADGIARVEQDRAALAEQADTRLSAIEAELRGTLDLIQQERAALEAARAAAAAEVQANRVAAAVAALRAAIDAGAPFAEPLATLTEISGSPPPQDLADLAADGVPPLAALRESFADGARTALEATLRAQVAAGEIGRIEGFWRIQSGVRSLVPRDGDDPDAVLSRAEAALAAGDLDGALALVAALPEAGRAAMDQFVAQAEARRVALAALAAYGDS